MIVASHRALIHWAYFLYYSSIFSNGFVLIYHTENSPSTQYYDCVYYTRSEAQNSIQGVKYCRQLNESQPLQRDFNQQCHNGGQLWSFEKLSLRSITAADVLHWGSSIEQSNHYAKYLFNNSLDVGDHYICNCTNPASFGKFCEYEFYGQSTSIDDAITQQFEARGNFSLDEDSVSVGSQLHGNRPCYVTWTCIFGYMCLDWRSICDGKQHCLQGLDEDHCETLEFNECEDDEYRCVNGMCIPEEYWLDGDYDCMDWTDEKETTVLSGDICFHIPSSICDEHSCPYNQWSCGNGQCISDETDRHEGTRLNMTNSFCKNMRDANYMCEAVTRYSKPLWTINKGYCLPYSVAYQNLTLDSTAAEDRCAFAVKCALSNGLDQDCNCKNTTACSNLVSSWCSDPNIFYPRLLPVLSSHFYMYYLAMRDWTKKKPDGNVFFGQVKCIGFQFMTTQLYPWAVLEKFSFYDHRLSEDFVCYMQDGVRGIRNYSAPHYDINCWNNSKTFNNRPYQVSLHCLTRCISKYRVRDGSIDCLSSDELLLFNNSCPQIQRHRLQCSPSELTCLLADAVGNLALSCESGKDEVNPADGMVLWGSTACKKRNDPGCGYVRDYIRMSSQNGENKTNITVDQSAVVIPFRSYCDSFLNARSGIDEVPDFCRQWICRDHEYRCSSGQCISRSWVCDNEWDCSDGSDEQRLFIMNSLDEHNSRSMDITTLREKCRQHYRQDNTPFSDICNISSEYPCYRTGVDDPFNITRNRPCIDLAHIGDSKIDCLSGLDERNLLSCSLGGMVGFHFRTNDGSCIEYPILCTSLYSWMPGVDIDHDSVCYYRRSRFQNGTVTNCNYQNDFMCLNDVCLKDVRCNGKIECPHGEDEYRCMLQNNYRLDKRLRPFEKVRLQNYPSFTRILQREVPYHPNRPKADPSFPLDETSSPLDPAATSESTDDPPLIYETRDSKVLSAYKIVRDSLPMGTITFKNHYLPFICNRGVAVKYHTGDIVCLCSPSYYGPQCEFHNDRITILTHLDLTHYQPSSHQIMVIKVLATLFFETRTIDYYEFHVHPQLQNEDNYVKQSFFFLYPRTNAFISMKRNNRSGTQLYSVRFEAFNLHLTGKIEPIGIWEHPIYFDFLPAFRLSKILRFRPPMVSRSSDHCSTDPCGKNGVCQTMINSHRSSYFCSCNSGYYGDHCESYGDECNNYCAQESICKPKYRSLVTGNQHPLCICPASTFGRSCYLKNDNCRQNPCLNGGSCIVTYDITDTNNYTCLCINLFAGKRCQYQKKTVHITFALTSKSRLRTADVLAATVSFSDYEIPSLRLIVRHQQVYGALPSYLELIHNAAMASSAPTTAIMKVYGPSYRNEESEYYILYFQTGENEIDITIDLTSENHCPLAQTLWHLLPSNQTTGFLADSKFNRTTAVFFYHRICQAKQNTNTKFTCFRDQNYLCMCESDHSRAECFGYNRSIDQCSLCLSDGYCLKGELNNKTNFLCLCPRCHHGPMCQYSSDIMSFSFDSLIIDDVQSSYQASCGVYLLIVVLIFLFGLFNNLCAFLTFIRPKPRKIGVGNYLLLVTIINQCSLLVLLLKIIHIIFGSNGTLFYNKSLNLYSCKIVSYFLSVFTRTTYWLTSFVTIERVCIVLFPTSSALKNPRFALGSSVFAILAVSGMHIHEALHYTTIVDFSYTFVNVTVCVTSYAHPLISLYNRVNVLVHYLVPFIIQVVSITVIVIQTACHRTRINSSRNLKFIDLFRKQFKTHRELYVTPIIIVFSSLPQTIVSFLYACTELKQLWQRYTLLTTIFLSYLPQTLGFILYVLPSTTYSNEFRLTVLGKKLLKQQRTSTYKRQNPGIEPRLIRRKMPTVPSSS